MAVNVPYANLDGNVLSAGQPDAEQFRALRDAGYTMVVNLRADEECPDFDERGVVEALGMEYRQIPVNGAAGMTADNARALQAAIAAGGGAPVLVHCGTGNRVGGLLAVAAWLDGADTEAAIAAGKRTGLIGLEPELRRRFERGDRGAF